MSYQAHWVFVRGRHRCQRCGEQCLGAWLFFEKPSTWTRCYCEPCAEILIAEHGSMEQSMEEVPR